MIKKANGFSIGLLIFLQSNFVGMSVYLDVLTSVFWQRRISSRPSDSFPGY